MVLLLLFLPTLYFSDILSTRGSRWVAGDLSYYVSVNGSVFGTVVGALFVLCALIFSTVRGLIWLIFTGVAFSVVLDGFSRGVFSLFLAALLSVSILLVAMWIITSLNND